MVDPIPAPAGAADADPPPQAPEKPLASDCCEGGCDRCVYDIYADELEAFEAALAAWRQRQRGENPG